MKSRKIRRAAMLVCICGHHAWAAPVQTFNFGASSFVEDPTRPIIYATAPSLNAIEVIDANTLQITNTINVGANPTGLGLNADGSRLYIAQTGSNTIGVLNTSTLTALTSLAAPGGSPTAVQVGNSNRLWVLGGGGIHQIDAATGASTGPDLAQKPGMYPLIISGGDMKISPDKNSLYYGNFGLSPSNGYKYDVTTAPVETWVLGGGGNGGSLTLSKSGALLSYTSFGDDAINVVRGTDAVIVGSIANKATTLAFTPDDKSAFTSVNFTHAIYKYDMTSFAQVGTFISTVGEAQRMFVDNSGTHLFVGEGSGTEVFTALSPPPPPPPPIPVIFNTGTDANGNRLGDGILGDPHYSLLTVANSGETKTLRVRTSAGGFPIGPWVGDDASSAWIGPNNNTSLYGAPGNYDYRTTFLAPAGMTSVTITGTWAADDGGYDIKVDGVSSGDTTSDGFGSLTAFTLTKPVIPGTLNTLDFLVNNGGGGDNPTGLRVEIGSVAFVPEPGAISMTALAGLALLRRRRRR